jgi:acetyltransferase-like isoleucine patch superfamily enzyme
LLRLYFLFARLFILKKQPYLRHIGAGQLFANWFSQKVKKINYDVPFQVHFTSRLTGYQNIVIVGNPDKIMISFAASGGCYYAVSANAKLEIGEGTIWAHNLNIQTSNHNPDDFDVPIEKDIKIGRHCWIGGNASILAGVELGDHVIVGANSVVTKSFPSNVVIGGCPARIIKTLPEERVSGN